MFLFRFFTSYSIGKVLFAAALLGCRRVALTSVSATRRSPIYATRPGSLPGRSSRPQCAVSCGAITEFLFPISPAFFKVCSGGDEGIRTPGLRRAKAALSQLSYIPSVTGIVGLTGFEPVTPALSAQCSNQLSYRPGERPYLKN